ncbi:unknown [Odoribacter sp. CAG:788]|jgi:hypothetical protein|nr:unknown [Odoribacter sp. CAG:788]
MPYSKFKAKIKITNLYILIFYSKLKEEEYLYSILYFELGL